MTATESTDTAGMALSAARARERATREILDVISRSRDDEQPVFDAILQSALALCDAPLGAVFMRDDDGAHFRATAHKALEGDWLDILRDNPPPADPGKSMIAEAAFGRRVVQVEDLKETDLYRSGEPSRLAAVDKVGMRTTVTVPMLNGEDCAGVICLYRREVKPFSSDQIALVETFAAQAVIAIENVRQFRELQNRLEREAATREILEVISSSRDDDQPVFDAILRSAARLCNAPMARLHLLEEDGRHRRLAAHWGESMRSLAIGEIMPMDEGHPISVSILDARLIHLEDISETELYKRGDPLFLRLVQDEGLRTLLTVPLMRDGKAFGCIALSRRERSAFLPNDIELVKTFAAQAVIAIDGVRQFRELRTRLEREAATRQILEVISRSRDDDGPVFDVILETAARLCEAPFAAMFLANPEGTLLTIPAHFGSRSEFVDFVNADPLPIDPSQSLAARVMISKQPFQVADFRDDPLYRAGQRHRVLAVDVEGMRTVLMVPLLVRDEAIGVIFLYRREVAPFNEDEVRLVETFAAQAVIAIENVRQFKALEARTAEVQALNQGLEARVEDQVGEIERMGRLKRFMPSAVADAVVSAGDDAMLASHRALLGILFCDIRGFTAFCETAEPEETIEVLQTYHEEMGKLIEAHGAGVDHRMGDGIMVLFNDPLPCDDPAGDALRLALAMRSRMAELCKGWKRLGHRLGFGVGISLGYATVGMVGSEGRYEYTASGTAVNLAARLCDEAEDGDILLSPRAYAAVEDDFRAESAGELSLKGIQAPVEVFRVVMP